MNDRYLKLLNINDSMKNLIIDYADNDFDLFIKLATEQIPLFQELVEPSATGDNSNQKSEDENKSRLDISDFEIRQGLNDKEIAQVKQMLLTMLSEHQDVSKEQVYEDLQNAINHKASWGWLVDNYPSLRAKIPTIDRAQQRLPGTPLRNVGITPSQEMIEEERLEIGNKRNLQEADYKKRVQDFTALHGREPKPWEVAKPYVESLDPEKVNIEYNITQQQYDDYVDDIVDLYNKAVALSEQLSNMHNDASEKEPYENIAAIDYISAVNSFKTVDDVINDLSARVKNLVYKIAIGSLGFSLLGAPGRQDRRRYDKSSPRILSEQDKEWMADIEQLKTFVEEVPKYSDINRGYYHQFHTRSIHEWFKRKKSILTEYIQRLEYAKVSYQKSLRFYNQLDGKLDSLLGDRISSTIPKDYIDIMQTTSLFDKIKKVYVDINKKLFGVNDASRYYAGLHLSVEEKMFESKTMNSVTEYLVFAIASVVSDIYNEIIRCLVDPIYVKVNQMSVDVYINEELGMSDAEMDSIRNTYGHPSFNVGSEYIPKLGNAILRITDSSAVNMRSMLQFGKFVFANKDGGQDIAKHLEQAALERIAFSGLERLYGDTILFLQNLLPTFKFPLDAFKEAINESTYNEIDFIKYDANPILANKFFEVHKAEIFKKITDHLRAGTYVFTYNQLTANSIFKDQPPQRLLALSKLIDDGFKNAKRKIGHFATNSVNEKVGVIRNRGGVDITPGKLLASAALCERHGRERGFEATRWIKQLLNDSISNTDGLINALKSSIYTSFFHEYDDTSVVVSYMDFCENRLQDLIYAASSEDKIRGRFGIPTSQRMMEFYKEDYLNDKTIAIRKMESFIYKLYDAKIPARDDDGSPAINLKKQKIVDDNFKMGLHYAQVAYERLAEFCDSFIALASSKTKYNDVEKPELRKLISEKVYMDMYNARMNAFGAVGPRAIAGKYAELEKLKQFNGLPMVAFGKLLEGQFHIDANNAIENFLNDNDVDLENSIFKIQDVSSSFFVRANSASDSYVQEYAFGIIAQLTGVTNPQELLSLYDRVKKTFAAEAENIGRREVDLIFPSIFSNGGISKLSLAIRLASLMHNSGANVPTKVFLSIARNPNFEHWGSRNVLDNYFNAYIKLYSLGGYTKFIEEHKAAIERLETSKVIDRGFRSKLKRFVALVNSGEVVNPSSSNFSDLKQLIDGVQYGLNAIKESATFAEFDKKVVKKDDSLFKLNWSPSDASFRFRVLQTFDPYHFKVGLDTNCCQKLGGVGENAAIDSYINPLAGVILLEIKDDGGWKTAAQSYFHYVPAQNGYILDNVEISTNARSIYSITNNTIDELYAIWAEHIKNTVNPRYILVGLNYTKINEDKFKKYKMNGDPRMFVHSKYSDWRPASSANLLAPKFQVDSKFLEANANTEKVSSLDIRYLYLKRIAGEVSLKNVGIL